jgi:hypothetical protein
LVPFCEYIGDGGEVRDWTRWQERVTTRSWQAPNRRR